MPSGFTVRPLDAQSVNKKDSARPRFLSAVPMRRPARVRLPELLARIRIRSGIRRTFDWLVRKKNELGWWKFLLRAFGIAVGLFVAYILLLWLTLPDIDDPESLFAAQSTIITDRNGIELYRLYKEEDRTLIPGNEIPHIMKQAVIAIEDKRFYDHGCVDIRAIVRAVVQNVIGGQSQGASTLTQQLARNALLTRQKRLSRKLKEIMLACELENSYDKETLLELYLNWIPFGQNAYGIEQASQRYFGKHAKQLTLPEAAVLASLPQRPSYFSPFGSHIHTTVSERVREAIDRGMITEAKDIPDAEVRVGLLGKYFGSGATSLYIGGRTDQVLKNMEEQGFITPAERQHAVESLKHITFTQGRENIRAPHFVLWVKRQLEEMYPDLAEKGLIEQGGWTVETTIDWRLQQEAESIVASKKEGILKAYGAHNIALMAMDPTTKEILAYVGNVEYSDASKAGKIDMVLTPRQPGSSFKPFVYATAFEAGYGPGTVLHDVPTKIGQAEPQNYEGGFWGVLTARKALAGSRNIPAIKAYFLAGEEDAVLETTAKLGAPTPLRAKEKRLQQNPDYSYGWPLGIGAAETPLLEMVHGYSTFASYGEWKPYAAIRRIRDKQGAVLPCSRCFDPNVVGEEVLDPRIAYQITSILSDVAARPGPFWQAALTIPGIQAAAKTGTSNKCLEWKVLNLICKKRKPDNVWTIGYTPAIVAGVWVGNASAEPMADNADGLNVAAPLWKEFMIRANRILKDKPTTFPMPEGLVQVQISTLSGELPAECTPVENRSAELFLQERAPTKRDPACVTLNVDKATGLLASDECPVEAQEKQSFYLPHSILPERFPQWEEGVQKWAHGTEGLPLPLAPSEKCVMTPERGVQPELTIQFPGDGGSATYPSFHPELAYKVGSGVTEIIYEIDGRVIKRATEPPYVPVLRMPRTIQKDGSHRLTVTLTDGYYNEVARSVDFRFEEDAGAPTVKFTAPQDGARIPKGAEVTLKAEATDVEGGIKYVEFYLDSVLLVRSLEAPYQVTYTMDASEGRHTLRAVAYDLAEHTSEDSIEITVGPGEAGAATPE
jgi:membrane peptidoglycan carboxypeptidase